MAYTKHTWETGQVITADKLNHMEDGIADGGGGGVLIVHQVGEAPSYTLDHTWQEIHDAPFAVLALGDSSMYEYYTLFAEFTDAEHHSYGVGFYSGAATMQQQLYEAASADDYPKTAK